jgi:hypothetical protein
MDMNDKAHEQRRLREPSGEMLTAVDLRDSLCTPYDELCKAWVDAALNETKSTTKVEVA